MAEEIQGNFLLCITLPPTQKEIYTTETYEGKRVQKFAYMGMAPVNVMDQGTPWPANKK